MQASSKQTIMGHALEVPKDAIFDSSLGVPLFWQERKTVACWKALMSDVKAKAVFDLTPGSGALARACMELGTNYAGLARSSEHCSWLQNILDRHALRAICTSGGPLFHQDLQQCIQQHFSDVLEQLNEVDKAVSTELKEEES